MVSSNLRKNEVASPTEATVSFYAVTWLSTLQSQFVEALMINYTREHYLKICTNGTNVLNHDESYYVPPKAFFDGFDNCFYERLCSKMVLFGLKEQRKEMSYHIDEVMLRQFPIFFMENVFPMMRNTIHAVKRNLVKHIISIFNLCVHRLVYYVLKKTYFVYENNKA